MKDFILIHKKFFVFIVCLFFVISYTPAAFSDDEAKKEEIDLAGPETALQSAMDNLFKLIETIEKEKGLSQKEKTLKILNNIKSVRWGPEKDNYFWVIDLKGNTLGEPVCIDLEGKSVVQYDIIDYKNDPDSKKLFDDLIKACNDNGQEFFQYLIPECKREVAQPKLALARLLAYKNWIIITWVYRDIIEAYQEPVETDLFVPVDDAGPEKKPVDDSQPASGT